METLKFNVIEAMRQRRSVRTYDRNKLIDSHLIDDIQNFANGVTNPFGIDDTRMAIVQRNATGEKQHLGTYGVISGANLFIGCAIHDKLPNYIALGYEFEQVVLYITSLGLGTVWLGGTLNRSGFAEAMHVPDDMTLPIISPIGYSAEKRLTERIFRYVARSDSRKPWEQLFFDGIPDTPLTPRAAGDFEIPLEMVRIAPSATNTQPWRVVHIANRWHFFAAYRDNASKQEVSFRHIDMGIALSHFILALQAQGLTPQITLDTIPNIPVPSDWHYIATVI